MSIKIDAQEYEVKLTTEAIGGEEGQAILGMETEVANIIIVDGTVPHTRQEEILVHEITHIAMPHLPEGMVKEYGARIYGALRDNNLLVEDLLAAVGATEATTDDMARVNKLNKEVQEPPPGIIMLGRKVSEKPWHEPVFTEAGALALAGPDGTLNRNAAHQAAAQLQGAGGGVKMSNGRKRLVARELAAIYRDTLKETPPRALADLAR